MAERGSRWDTFRLVLGGTILACWVASITLNAIDRTYNPPITIHALMLVVATWAFADRVIGRREREGRDDE